MERERERGKEQRKAQRFETFTGRLNDTESANSKLDDELNSLRRDKNLLVDHVSELQKKVDDRDTTILHLRQQVSKFAHCINILHFILDNTIIARPFSISDSK